MRSGRETARSDLRRLVQARVGVDLEPQLPVIGYARRMTGYKRPDLLFADVARLERLAREHPFQLVMAGKAHPHDQGGRDFIAQLHALEIGRASCRERVCQYV